MLVNTGAPGNIPTKVSSTFSAPFDLVEPVVDEGDAGCVLRIAYCVCHGTSDCWHADWVLGQSRSNPF